MRYNKSNLTARAPPLPNVNYFIYQVKEKLVLPKTNLVFTMNVWQPKYKSVTIQFRPHLKLIMLSDLCAHSFDWHEYFLLSEYWESTKDLNFITRSFEKDHNRILTNHICEDIRHSVFLEHILPYTQMLWNDCWKI